METAAKLLSSLKAILAVFPKRPLKSLDNQTDFDSPFCCLIRPASAEARCAEVVEQARLECAADQRCRLWVTTPEILDVHKSSSASRDRPRPAGVLVVDLPSCLPWRRVRLWQPTGEGPTTTPSCMADSDTPPLIAAPSESRCVPRGNRLQTSAACDRARNSMLSHRTPGLRLA